MPLDAGTKLGPYERKKALGLGPFSSPVGGGFGPKWRGDGKELFYQSLDGMLMSVSFEHGPDAELAAPVPLFKVHSRFDETATDFDVNSDGQTFLINTAIEDDKALPMSVIINFMNEWERR